MSTDLTPFFVVGLVMVAIVLALALWRKVVAKQEDDTLHVLADAGTISHQAVIAQKLEVIDKWGKLLTIITALYVVSVFVAYVYQYWVQNSAARF